jgi:tRNA pseudouridine55 synthase
VTSAAGVTGRLPSRIIGRVRCLSYWLATGCKGTAMTDGARRTGGGFDGLLVIDKPAGCSSMDVVRRVRRAAGGVKTGHAGTLDPLASGVVICCLGSATRVVPRLMDLPKTYVAEVDLSAFTPTDDREGQRQEVLVPVPPDAAAVTAALPAFIGEIQQRPPAFSAVHVQGRRAYKLARRGEAVVLPPRMVRIDGIELLDYTWPVAALRIDCGKGTYIRSLARDLGAALGTGGHLQSLRRTAVGPYHVGAALRLDDLPAALSPEHLLMPPPQPL